uniref:Membrane-bound transcription factor site-2 protease n=1 Tax=Cacopsylla melanoneura TaxID=428564 RepID=A0A8D8Y7P6_9HEMI
MNTNLILLLSLVTIMYLLIYFLDKYLKKKSQSYINFMTKHNIKIHFLYITLQTKTFNRMIYKISHVNITKKCPSIKYTLIYNMGVVCTIVSIPISVYVIVQSVYSNLVKPQSSSLYMNDNEEHYINVKPLVIGVNLPMSHLFYYITSLLVCIVIHELGHAVCALHENIRLNYVGIVLVFIIPVIYVDIENIHTAQVPISVLAKLRIYCAGIWHNILLTLLMYVILYSFPILTSPLYLVNEGVQVTHMGFNSPLKTTAGKFGLEPFDVIVKINECRVVNEMTYKQCLLQLNSSKNIKRGYCLTNEFVEKQQETFKSNELEDKDDCCARNQTKHLCFVQSNISETAKSVNNNENRIKRHVGNNAYRVGNGKPVEIGKLTIYKESDTPESLKDTRQIEETVVEKAKLLVVSSPNVSNNSNVHSKNNTPVRYCMQARLVLDNSKQSCVSSDQCSPLTQCYLPLTSHALIQIHLRQKSPYVLYLGRPVDVYNTLNVNNYIQKYSESVTLAYIPSVGHNMAVYISILSSGLALVNAIPCYYFDSQHIISILVTRSYLRFCIHVLSTLLLVTYFLLFIPSTLFSNPIKR